MPSRPREIAATRSSALQHYDRVVDIAALRAQTPGCAHRVHLNNAGAALMAQPTLEAMAAHLQLEAEVGGYEAVAELVGVRSAEVAFFDNATHAWNAGFYSVRFGRGDRILTGRAEYGSNVLAYLHVAQRTGAEVVVVPNDEHGQIDVAALERLVDERTRLIGLSHVPTSGGLVNPAAEVGRIAREAGVLFLLDATQSVGQFPVDANTIGCDLLTSTGRKFLRGPRGTGFLWVRPDALERLDPFVAEIRSATWDGRRGFDWVDGARRFESWENSYMNQLGLRAAVRQALELGLDAIAERTLALGTELRERLDELPGVSTHDLGEERCAIVTARVADVASADVAAALKRAGVNVTVTVPEDTQFDTEDRGLPPLVRLSPHYYNTVDELEYAVEQIAALRR